MDIRCSRCGEPWDHDSIHEEIDYRREMGTLKVLPLPEPYDQSSPAYKRYRAVYDKAYSTVSGEFRSKGCEAFTFAVAGPCVRVESEATAAAQAVYELLGDDLDGAAAMLDDFSAAGLL